jgi:hypothetical protein
MVQALTDPNQRWEPSNPSIAYNNFTDRMRMELPEYNDPASSGVVYTSVDAASFVHNYSFITSNVRGAAIWTPATGKRFVITDMIISANSAGTINVYDGANSGSNTIVQLTMAAATAIPLDFKKPYPSSAINNILKLDSYSNCSGYITVNGFEI